jgi:hypothetical protein
MSKKIYHETMSALENSLTCALIASDLFTVQNGEFDVMGIMPEISSPEEIHGYAKLKRFSCVPLYVKKKNLYPPYWFDEVFIFDRLNEDKCTRRNIKPEDIISSSTPISKLIGLFNDNDGKKRDFYLVLENERICKIVTIADLNKLPVRVCLSAMIAHLEGLMSEIIETKYPVEKDWLTLLNVPAQEFVNKLYQDKIALDFDVSMIDCTTIIHKFTILYKTASFLEYLEVSKKEYDKIYKLISRLRNRNFHNMDTLTDDSMFENDSMIENVGIARDHVAHNQKLKKKIDIGWLSDTVCNINRWIDAFSKYDSNVASNHQSM